MKHDLCTMCVDSRKYVSKYENFPNSSSTNSEKNGENLDVVFEPYFYNELQDENSNQEYDDSDCTGEGFNKDEDGSSNVNDDGFEEIRKRTNRVYQSIKYV